MKYKVSCSFGEIVDKLSILNIKSKKISDENAILNIKNEKFELIALCNI